LISVNFTNLPTNVRQIEEQLTTLAAGVANRNLSSPLLRRTPDTKLATTRVGIGTLIANTVFPILPLAAKSQ